MATVINTGSTLTLTINSIARSEQITSAQFANSTERPRFKMIGGTQAFAVVDDVQTLDCEILLDWSSGTSDFADALWTAYTTAPNTAISFVLAQNGQSFTGTLLPMLPPVGGGGADVSTWTVSFPVVGIPTKS